MYLLEDILSSFSFDKIGVAALAVPKQSDHVILLSAYFHFFFLHLSHLHIVFTVSLL